MKRFLRIAALAVCAMTMVVNAYAQAAGNRQKATAEETGGNVVVLLETASWGQNHPFNNQCWTKYNGTTHAKTGCVATAYAIVMRHHKYPKEGTANKLYNCQAPTYVELTDRVYDWDNMPLMYDGNWSEEQIYEVSKIMSHLAHAHMSSFGSGATTANEERETARLNRYFNYPKIAAAYQREHTREEWEAKSGRALTMVVRCHMPQTTAAQATAATCSLLTATPTMAISTSTSAGTAAATDGSNSMQ